MELCILCILVKKEGETFSNYANQSSWCKKNPRTHATPRQMLESYCFMHWVPRRWLVKCRPWWIHSCWKRIRTCDSTWSMFHLSGSPSPCLFLPAKRAKIRPKSPVATRYGYVNVTDMKAMANLASFLTLEPDVVSKEMKVCPRPLASVHV